METVNVNEIKSTARDMGNENTALSSSLSVSKETNFPEIDPQQAPFLESEGTYDKLNQFFSEQDQQEKTVLEAREILGESAKDLTDEQVYDLVTEMQYLADCWLEEFERKVFDGKTLNELLSLEP